MRTLRVAIITAGTAMLLIAAGAGGNKKLDKERRVEHALNRLAFGPRPGEVERVRKMGLDRWIDEQLHPERLPLAPQLAERLRGLPTLGLSIADLARDYSPKAAKKGGESRRPALRELLEASELRLLRQGTPAEKVALIEALPAGKRTAVLQALPLAARRELLAAGNPELRREVIALGNPAALPGLDLAEAKLYRAIYSERQLEEVLVDFWFNHFNVYMNKGPERLMVGAYERDAIRPYVLGKFGEMLLATARHPAMLYYLDNWQSVDPQAMERLKERTAGRRAGVQQLAKRTRGLNENYARELMELHTLGVDGGYTQQDVIEVARCFTGWTLREPRRGASFYFAPMLHDPRAKTVLGHRIGEGGGEEDGRKVIEILVNHPATARFLSTKLAQRFVADQPPAALVNRMAATFGKTGGDLREVMKTMIGAPEFFTEAAWRAKLKSPFELVVSATRAAGAEVSGALALSRTIEELGQPLYRKEEPTGYYNTAEEWTNTAGLVGRMNFGTALASGKVPGVKTPESLRAGLSLAAPEFQRR